MFSLSWRVSWRAPTGHGPEKGPRKRDGGTGIRAACPVAPGAGRRPGAFVPKQGAVEVGHQPRRGLVADAPQADDNLGRAGVHEATGQPDQPFAADKRAQSGFACAQDDEFGGQLQVEDVRQSDDTFARLSRGVKP